METYYASRLLTKIIQFYLIDALRKFLLYLKTTECACNPNN